jgi:hypothetical protein
VVRRAQAIEHGCEDRRDLLGRDLLGRRELAREVGARLCGHLRRADA